MTEPNPEGVVRLFTRAGKIDIELFSREAPNTCRNFVQLCLEGYYEGCEFFRVIPGFIVQTGDKSNTGKSGDSIYDEGYFPDEFSQRLQFTRRGLVASANLGKPNTNQSQFFITLDKAPQLNRKNTIFGRISMESNTIYNVLKIGEGKLYMNSEQPMFPVRIEKVEVVENPFDDIVPRITSEQRRLQEKVKHDHQKEKRSSAKSKHKGKAHRNKAVLSFNDDDNDNDFMNVGKFSVPSSSTITSNIPKKIVSAHDILRDPHFSAQDINKDERKRPIETVIDDDENAAAKSSKNGTSDTPRDLQGVSVSTNDKHEGSPVIKEQRQSGSIIDETKEVTDMEKQQQMEPDSLNDRSKKLSFVEQQRAKYKNKSKFPKDDLLERAMAFRKKVSDEAKRTTNNTGSSDDDSDSSNDTSWMGSKLRFRKDATHDIHHVDEYSVQDPLAEN